MTGRKIDASRVTLSGEVAMAAGALAYLSDDQERWAAFIGHMLESAPEPPPTDRLLQRERGRSAAVDLLELSAYLISPDGWE